MSRWLSILWMVVLMYGRLRVNEFGVFLFQRRSAITMVNISLDGFSTGPGIPPEGGC